VSLLKKEQTCYGRIWKIPRERERERERRREGGKVERIIMKKEKECTKKESVVCVCCVYFVHKWGP
jgi:hypothetical protein